MPVTEQYSLWDTSRTMFGGQKPMSYQPQRFPTSFTGKVIDLTDLNPETQDSVVPNTDIRTDTSQNPDQ